MSQPSVKKEIRKFLDLVNRQRDTAWKYVSSLYRGARDKELFESIENYCMFVGYPRSGHSLVGSLLNAHPEMVIAHEVNVLRFLEADFRKNQLYSLILMKDKTFEKNGREQAGYHYNVPNQWQGKFRMLRVVGDKKGGRSTLKLMENPRLLHRLQKTVRVPLKFIHVLRNPYDNIATISKRKKLSLIKSIDFYFSLCRTVARVKKQLSAENILDVRLESLIHDPRTEVKRCCDFLGVESTEDYLNDCASIVFESPRKTRQSGEWSKELIQAVKEKMALVDFLEGYSYEC